MSRLGGVFDLQLIDERPGLVTCTVAGAGCKSLFINEAGGHRWQRVPPTEKRGRVHTSTVTVAVLDPDAVVGQALDMRDVEVTTVRGSGPGGQHRNKTESCVVVTHKPTSTQVRVDNERSQHQNKAIAMKILAAKLYGLEKERIELQRLKERKEQVGSGQRGDKIRTYRTQDNQVTDHRTGVKFNLSRWYDGNW